MYYYNQRNYGNINYDNKSTHNKVETISTSGCGVCSACMAVNNLVGKELYTVKQMAEFSIKNGARDNSGTNEYTLLKALCKVVTGLSFTTTTDETKLVSHLKAGGIAIANQGSAYNVFSTAGHYVVCYRMNGNNIEVLDPCMYSGKYDQYSRPKRIVKKTTNGCIVNTTELNKATRDRSPSYYLVSYKKSAASKPISTSKPTATTTSVSTPTFKVGSVYTLTTNVKVRTGAGTNYSQKKRSQLTINAKAHAVNQTYAVLKSGTRFTVQEVKKNGADIWVRIPSGWICVYYKGSKYAK